MLQNAKRWAILTLCACLLLLMLSALTVYIVDPFEQYRESSILPLYDQESYNNPGIAKNYDYNAVILGTSMVEMSNPSVIDACFGVSSVKLPMRGSYSAQMGWQLRHIFEDRALDMAILAVDPYQLMGWPEDTAELFDYLWNDNPLDDVNYLLNRDVLLVRVPKMLKNIGKATATKRDDMYKWTDVTFAAKSVYDAIGGVMQQSEMQELRRDRATENITRHIEPYIAAHPETAFKVYIPPYSVGYWYVFTRGGLSEQQFSSREVLCELLLKYSNVEIYDFSSRIEWITDLDEYFDCSHHSSAISDALMRAMAAGENRVMTVDDMRAGNQRIRDAVEAFAKTYEN